MHNTYERGWLKDPTQEDVKQVFLEAYENGLEVAAEGRCADYIPELAKADPGAFGIHVLNKHGAYLSFGDVETRFSIQSISKVINLAVSLKYRGFRETFSHVMMEPSGDAFNSILKLDTRSNLPFNPMINAGAIETVGLLAEEFSFEDLLQFTRELCMDPDIYLDEAVYTSERDTGFRIGWGCMCLSNLGERKTMSRIITGQILLILCCAVYLIWWYRGFRPGVMVSRVGGVNGALLLITAALGLAGVIFSLTPVQEIREAAISQAGIVIAGIASYFLLLFITKELFHRVVTTELFLIVGWTMLEMTVADRLYAAGALGDGSFGTVCVVIAAAFLISIVLYVAYYRMEEMKAFYAAMVPLVTEAAAMAVLTGIVIGA